MISNEVILYQWQNDGPEDLLDIDWPKIQKECGVDHIKWLMDNESKGCYMALEITPDKSIKRLIVEFDDPQILSTYHMLWAR